MFDRLISEIQKAVTPQIIELDGEPFISREVHLPPEPTITPLKMATLSGFCDFVKTDPAAWQAEGCIIQVISEKQVSLVSDMKGRHKERDYWAIADCSNVLGKTFEFGQYMLPENFIINLLTNFVATENRDRLLQLVGSMTEESSRSLSDDGVSQKMTVRSGISLVDEVKIKNPVRLAPYRTFREIDQPSGDFVFRLQKGRSDKPEVALFAADGGAWKLDAISFIKTYLESSLEGIDLPILA